MEEGQRLRAPESSSRALPRGGEVASPRHPASRREKAPRASEGDCRHRVSGRLRERQRSSPCLGRRIGAGASLAMGTRNGEQLTEVSPSEWQKSMLFGSPPCSPQMPTSSVGRTLRPFCAPAKHPRDRRRPGADMGRASIRSRKRSGSLCAIQLPSGRCASAALRQRHVRLCDLPNRAHPSRRPEVVPCRS